MAKNAKPEARSYFASVEGFTKGYDSPREFLERCIARIKALESDVGAFVATNFRDAQAAADEASARWKSGETLSAIDGMPIGIKDIMETADMPTEQGSPLFEGWRGGRDSAVVASLREAGAVIVGKTVTTEFAAAEPRGTRNPWDLKRTPGGSSSGSAAAVAAGMLPAALGTQVLGSILRPSSFCGCFGFKPSIGGINRGGSFDEFSQSCTGVLAATLAESWALARELSSRAGGDPGTPGLLGPMQLPDAELPGRVALLQTPGWEKATDEAKQGLSDTAEKLTAAGVEIVDRNADDAIEAAEQAINDAMALSLNINAWEGRWPLNSYARDMERSKLSDGAQARLATGNEMSQDDYQRLIGERDQIRRTYGALSERYEVCLTLSAPGAAPIGLAWTGDSVFVAPGSLLGTPAVSLPLLKDEDLPLGLQIMGFLDRDAAMFAAARAMLPIVGDSDLAD